MYTVLVVAEGGTDFDALQGLVGHIAKEQGVPCQCVRLFPAEDATSGILDKGGWARLMDWTKRWNANPQPASLSSADAATWAAIGMTGPVKRSPVTWTTHLAPYPPGQGILLFHLDGDIAEELAPHHPDKDYKAGLNRVAYCRHALQHWTGLGEDQALWCIPVQCLETWFLTLHPLKQCQQFSPDMQDYESLPTAGVCELLLDLGHEAYTDPEIGKTVDKIRLTEKYTAKLAHKLDSLTDCCPSAERFFSEVRQRLQA